MLTGKRAPPFCQFFWFGSDPKIYIYLLLEISFFLHLGTHPIKTGEELLYYHLYHEKAQLYPDVHTQLINRPFIIFFKFKLTITYNGSTHPGLYLYTTIY